MIDDYKAYISMFLIFLTVFFMTKEFIKSILNKKSYLSKMHIDKHINILMWGNITFMIVLWGVYRISLTPIKYVLNNGVTAQEAFKNNILDFSKVTPPDDFSVFISALNSDSGVIFSIGILVFIYLVVHHLEEEREGKAGGDYYD